MITQSTYVIDEQNKVLGHDCDLFEYKSDAENPDTITGYVATKTIDSAKDKFTEDALKSMAQQINNDVEHIKVIYQDFDEEVLEELKDDGTMGNIDHNNHPNLFPLGDLRTVPAFRIKSAEFDGFGTKVKAELATDAYPDDISEAIKAAVKQKFLNAMSVEFKPTEAEERSDGVRIIKSVVVNGAALTGRPVNSTARITNYDIKSLVSDEIKSKTVAGVSFTGTKQGKLDEPSIPNDDFESHYLFPGDNKSDSSYPVVDGDGYLRRGNVESAYQVGARGGVSDEELTSKLKKLNDEFENPPIDFENESKSNISEEDSNMTEEDVNENQEQKSDQKKDEVASLKEEMADIKSAVDKLKETNKELKEENEELKSKIEDEDELKSVIEDISEIKGIVEELEPEEKPKTSQENETKSQNDERVKKLARIAKVEGKSRILKSAGDYAEQLDMDEDEVKNYVEEL